MWECVLTWGILSCGEVSVSTVARSVGKGPVMREGWEEAYNRTISHIFLMTGPIPT